MSCPNCGNERAWTKCWPEDGGCGWSALDEAATTDPTPEARKALPERRKREPLPPAPVIDGYVVVLPLPPNVANTTHGHRMSKTRERTAYRKACLAWYPRSPARTLERATVRATFYVHSLMDPLDNLPARLKWALDWIVDRGFLADDGPDRVRWAEQPGQVVDRKNQRVVIELEAA